MSEFKEIAKSAGRRIAVPLAIAGFTLGGAAVAAGAAGAEGQTNTGTTDSATEQHVQELKDAGAMKYKLVVPGLSKAEEPPTPTPTPVRPTPTPDNRLVIEGLDVDGTNVIDEKLNQKRIEQGLSSLPTHQSLANAAGEYARFLMDTLDFTSIDPNTIHSLKGDPRSRINGAGFPGTMVGENIAYGIIWTDREAWVKSAIDGWMQSPGHKGTALSSLWTNVGAACVVDKVSQNRIMNGGRSDIMVPMFICVADYGSTNPPPPPPPPGR